MKINCGNIKSKIFEIEEAIRLSKTENNSLLTGDAGKVLFYFYLSRIFKSKKFQKTANNLLENIFDSLNENLNSFSYCSGLTGICWMIVHLQEEQFIDTNIDQTFYEIDEVVFDSGKNYIKQKNFDFLHGSLGILFYLNARAKTDLRARFFLNQLLQQMLKEKKNRNDFIYWSQTPLLPNEHGKSIINFSLSHGLASIIAVFADCIANESCAMDLKPIIKGIINIYHSYKKVVNGVIQFPSTIINDQVENYQRLAWCYGSLGISVALFKAGIAMDDYNLRQEAIDICLSTTCQVSPNETFVQDACICHGTAGIALVYNNMFKRMKNKKFKNSADYWIANTIQMANFNDGLAGFKTLKTDGSGFWKNDTGLLEGLSGIGLSFLSWYEDKELNWDKCLLLK